jgi:glutathione S-transferase
VRHTHPGLAPLEQPQFPDYGHSQAQKVREIAQWFDHVLERQPWMAGERFTIADITAFCAIEFAKLMHFNAGKEGMPALQAWRDKVNARTSARA